MNKTQSGVLSFLSIAVLAGLLAASTTHCLSAQEFIVSSRFSDRVLRYSADGTFLGPAARGRGLDNPNGVALGPDGLLYVSNGDRPLVQRFDPATGRFVDRFVRDDPATADDETGGLVSPRGLTFGPEGNLYVCSGGGDQVLHYDGATGAFLDVFAEHAQLDGPVALAFGPDGDLYVSGAISSRVVVFDGVSGEFLRILMVDGELVNPTGMAFDGSGGLYVASAARSTVWRFDLETGTPSGPTIDDPDLEVPIGLMFHPEDDGRLLIAAFESDSIRAYDETGQLIGDIVEPGAGGLDGAHYLQFLPQEGVDCTQVRKFKVTCSASGVLKAKVRTQLAAGSRLTVENNATVRLLTLRRKGKGTMRFRGQAGLHGVSLLECPTLRRVVDCG